MKNRNKLFISAFVNFSSAASNCGNSCVTHGVDTPSPCNPKRLAMSELPFAKTKFLQTIQYFLPVILSTLKLIFHRIKFFQKKKKVFS